MKLISLTQGYEAMVDDEDYEVVMKYKWHAANHTHTYYAKRSVVNDLLQNFLMKPPSGFVVDHIDRNGLNNQRSNLRLATRQQNLMNRKFSSKTEYKGVTKNGNGYRTLIYYNYKQIYIGTFKTSELAARAYDIAAKQYHGEFAVLNFPEGDK